MLLKKLANRLIFTVQIFLVAIFIIFEELIWEGIAKPIYDYIHELHILQSLQKKLKSVNRYVVLVVFVVLLVFVELAGLAAGVMAVNGMVLSAMLLYALKIPIAAFVFWLFHATESKLLSFGWFRWLYELILSFFAWIKSLDVYHDTMDMVHLTKQKIRELKIRYFSGDSAIAKRFQRLYATLKRMLNGE